jgi:hypothetical protein
VGPGRGRAPGADAEVRRTFFKCDCPRRRLDYEGTVSRSAYETDASMFVKRPPEVVISGR